jgi:branched-chain amino acid transport system substrate-binding protein
VVTLGKALLFPSAVEALGELGEGLSTEVWWSPSHPFTSSLTRESAAQLAASYEQASGKQWTQPIGFSHALFEVAADALKRAKDPRDKAALRDAIAATDLATIVGQVKFGGPGPFKNVSRTPLVLGQWVPGKKHRYELAIVNNEAAPQIPAGGKLQLIS